MSAPAGPTRVWVRGIPEWADPRRLLGPGEWTIEGRSAHATLAPHAAADLAARLRNVGLGGATLEVTCEPPLPRAAVRAARTTDARRRRDTSPGFTRPGARLDPEGKVSLTPEALALAIGRRAATLGQTPDAVTVVDAGCGAGGNTIGFARAGCRVVAIEADAARIADARHNARLYGVADRVRFVHGDAAALLRTTPGDLLFLDPPWGVDWARDVTRLDAFPLLADVVAHPPPFVHVWAKLPPSFDVRDVPGARAEAVYGVAPGDERRVKFLLLRWRTTR